MVSGSSAFCKSSLDIWKFLVHVLLKSCLENLEHWKRLMLGKIEGRKRMILLDGITDSVDMNLSKLWEIVKDREAWYAASHWVSKSWTQLSD